MATSTSHDSMLSLTLVKSDNIAYCHFHGFPKITKIFCDGPQPIGTVLEYLQIYKILFEVAGNYRKNILKVDHKGVYSMEK